MYTMTIRPRLLAEGILGAAIVALIGGLFPAIRAARLPVATALRAT
jgi:putative ABC transport system permease protein